MSEENKCVHEPDGSSCDFSDELVNGIVLTFRCKKCRKVGVLFVDHKSIEFDFDDEDLYMGSISEW